MATAAAPLKDVGRGAAGCGGLRVSPPAPESLPLPAGQGHPGAAAQMVGGGGPPGPGTGRVVGRGGEGAGGAEGCGRLRLRGAALRR